MEKRWRNDKYKRGQIQLSFGMIFSIIVIIATVAVAFYVIKYFLNLNKCNEIGFFYNDLQEEIDKAWASNSVQDVFQGRMPSGIESVCFGNSTLIPRENKKEYDALKNYILTRKEKNVFLYPGVKACDSGLAYYGLKHARIDEFFCEPVENGKVSIKFKKSEFEALVQIVK